MGVAGGGAETLDEITRRGAWPLEGSYKTLRGLFILVGITSNKSAFTLS